MLLIIMAINAEDLGEPYIIHPLNVAYILADIGLDDSTICAALLHDVVEDTDVTDNDIRRDFGVEIAQMVAGVTKLSNMMFTSIEEQQAEDYRKMFLQVAGEKKEYEDGITVAKLIELENVETPQYVTVTLNDEFLQSGTFEQTVLKDSDSVEFLYFMGGGAF